MRRMLTTTSFQNITAPYEFKKIKAKEMVIGTFNKKRINDIKRMEKMPNVVINQGEIEAYLQFINS